MYCYIQKRDKYNVLLYEQRHGSKAERKSRLLLFISEVGRRQKQAPKAITVGCTTKARGGGKSVAKAKVKAEIAFSKAIFAKAKAKSPER